MASSGSGDNLLTFKRKKKSKNEVKDLAEEGRKAIEHALCSLEVDDPETYMLEEGQERTLIEKASMESNSVKELICSLITWINDELVNHRILVRNIADDLYDGQILQNLAEKLAGIKLEHPEVTQSEFGQMQRLKEVVKIMNNLLGLSDSWASRFWTPAALHNKDLIAILRLLVALSRHFKSGIRIKDGVYLTVIIVRKINGLLDYRYQREYITDPPGDNSDGDAGTHPLDVLPNRHLVPKLIMEFVNSHLKKLRLEVMDLTNDFSDGVLFILLMGLLEGYFIPLFNYYPVPTSDTMRRSNVELSFELMRAADIPEPMETAESVVARDAKAILRLLYGIFSHYQLDVDQISQLQVV